MLPDLPSIGCAQAFGNAPLFIPLHSYEHKWIYDFEEFAAVAVHAGIPRSSVTRSARLAPELPESFHQAVRAAEIVATARRQHGMRENPTRCWLEQEVREPETLYVTITKR